MAEEPGEFTAWRAWWYDWSLPWLSLPLVFAASRASLERLHRDAAIAAGEGVLVDAPCGSALFTAPVAAGPVIGVDLSPAMLAVARKRLPRALLVRGDAMALPLRDGCADALISSLGLQFLPDRARGLAEARRVVRAGGLFAGAAPALGLHARYDRRYARRAQKDFPLDRDRFTAELATAGFTEVDLQFDGALILWRAR